MASLDFPSNPTVGQEFAASGKTWVWNSVAWAIKRTFDVPSVYRIGSFFTATPGETETLFMHVATDSFTLPANLAGSQVNVGINPSANVEFSLNKNNTTIGSITVSNNGVATLATNNNAPVRVAAGDLLTLVSPNNSLGIAATAFTFRGDI